MVTLCVWPDVGLYRAANLEVLREVLVDLGADSARAVLALLAGDPARHAIVRVHLVEGHLQPLRYLRRGNQRAQQLSAGSSRACHSASLEQEPQKASMQQCTSTNQVDDDVSCAHADGANGQVWAPCRATCGRAPWARSL